MSVVRVRRFVPGVDAEPVFREYEVQVRQTMTVLDVVLHLREKVDASLAFAHCCRNGHCGLCGAVINGKPGLMCREPATEDLVLEPLRNLPVQRDLLLDLASIEDRLLSLRLFLDRVTSLPAHPLEVRRETLQLFKVVSRCVRCFCCESVCPAVARSRQVFHGPAAAVLLARHVVDPRDQLDRAPIVAGLGLSECTGCGKCDEVCPQGIRPSEVVEFLRSRIVLSRSRDYDCRKSTR